MNVQPLVTIVVISYNQGKYIKENLDSIKNQSYPNIELIVADDASTDKSVEIFDNWLIDNNYPAKKNYHQKNTGLATMLNECIELATGKYIKLIAADDFLHLEAIEKCVQKLEELGETYGMIFTDTFAIDENSRIINDIADYNSLGNITPLEFKKELIRGNRIPALTVIMRLTVLKETGQYDSKLIVEDYYRWLKINEKYFITYIPEKLAYYRQHDNNISKLKEDRIILESIWLKIIFDKDGLCKDEINYYVLNRFLNNADIPSDFKTDYCNYRHASKRLSKSLKFNIPKSLFKVINKIS